MLFKVELMKKAGTFTKEDLAALGLNDDSKSNNGGMNAS